MHKTLYNWKARRAGPAITVYGQELDGTEVKIVGVAEIVTDPAGECDTAVFAKTRDGECHVLRMGKP